MAMSVMEIHADSISDLLSPEPRRRLQVKQVSSAPRAHACLTTPDAQIWPTEAMQLQGQALESRQAALTL